MRNFRSWYVEQILEASSPDEAIEQLNKINPKDAKIKQAIDTVRAQLKAKMPPEPYGPAVKALKAIMQRDPKAKQDITASLKETSTSL